MKFRNVLIAFTLLTTSQLVFSQEERLEVKPILPKPIEFNTFEPKPLQGKPVAVKPAFTEVKANKKLVIDTLRVEPINTVQHFSLTRDKDSVIIRRIDRKD